MANISNAARRIPVKLHRGMIFGFIILLGLLAFEAFNYTSTQFALSDILGELSFAGFRWATILALAFCGIDFAGIARIFTPEQGKDEPAEVWYLFGAWFLAAAFNASLTWWGVTVAIIQQNSVLISHASGSATVAKIVPVFIAAIVLLVRVLLINTFSIAGDKIFSMAREERDRNKFAIPTPNTSTYRPQQYQPQVRPAPSRTPAFGSKPTSTAVSRPPYEPTYHPVGMNNDDAKR